MLFRPRSLSGCRARDGCWPSGTRTRMPDTLGATLAVAAIVEACGGRADPVCTDPVPELYGFLAGIERFRADPDPDADYDLLVISDCGTLDRVGAVGERHAELFERLPRVVLDHHASNDDERQPADWVDPDAAATCEMVTLLAARLGVPLDTGDGSLAAALMAGIVMDTATFAHPNATPRTLVVSAALVEAGAPFPTFRAASTAPSRNDSSSCSAACSIGWSRATTAGSCGPRWRTPTSRPRAASRPTPKASSICSPRRKPQRWRSSSSRLRSAHG